MDVVKRMERTTMGAPFNKTGTHTAPRLVRHGLTWGSQVSVLVKHIRRVRMGYRILPPLLK